MKINDNQLNGLNGTGLNGPDRTHGAAPTTAGSSGGPNATSADGDRVHLSGLSQALRIETEDTPERLARVNQLRDSYVRGTYQPDPLQVSRSLVRQTLLDSGTGA